MAKVIIVFASMSGNTEELSDAIAEGVKAAGLEPVVKNVMDTEASQLEQYDAIIIGAYTWGDGELPDEMLDYYEAMDGLDLNGKQAAVFGSGDSAYDIFCGAVDTLEQKLKDRGAAIAADSIKVELNPTNEETEQCRALGRRLAELAAASV
ncbi:flavodoxin [Paenibacillus sp. MMS18-CY102]|uniref:flavodoxin n=1 Tax=Paenibacillus sp. MMS18-CY102 TaxID=2682849 RepID=UPI0013659132|nr:flavodoxin [Paenibacillus sp. MMS18-CY102]MWC27772.1 flavodoxin [Paenibacillus sp. MMS18-CY102]